MNFDRKTFFDHWRQSFGPLDQGQVKTLSLILDYWEGRGSDDIRWVAYCMATAHGEVGKALQPVREGFASGDAEARRHVAKLKRDGKIKVNYALPDKATGKSYYGRGLVQLTHKSNYETMGAMLGIDLVHQPDLALEPATAVRILCAGMERGSFTRLALKDYFVMGHPADWTGARRIVNGTDKDERFAELGRAYHKALMIALNDGAVPPPPDVEPPPKPDRPMPSDVEPDLNPLPPPVGQGTAKRSGQVAVGLFALLIALIAGWLGLGSD